MVEEARLERLEAGLTAVRYHREANQEDFLVSPADACC